MPQLINHDAKQLFVSKNDDIQPSTISETVALCPVSAHPNAPIWDTG
jgi:hypothetical protein